MRRGSDDVALPGAVLGQTPMGEEYGDFIVQPGVADGCWAAIPQRAVRRRRLGMRGPVGEGAEFGLLASHLGTLTTCSDTFRLWRGVGLRRRLGALRRALTHLSKLLPRCSGRATRAGWAGGAAEAFRSGVRPRSARW